MADNTSKINDLVAMLDQFVTSGSGHINVRNEGDETVKEETPSIDTKKSNECTPNMACSVPTLHQGIDDEEEPTI